MNPSVPNDGRERDRQELIQQETTEMLRSISSSLELLAKTKNAARVSGLSAQQMQESEWMYSVTPAGMDVPINLSEWTGPLKSVVEMLADYTGYEVKEVGSATGRERPVTIKSDGRVVRDVLADVASQAGCDALVTPISTARVVVIDWTYRTKKAGCKSNG